MIEDKRVLSKFSNPTRFDFAPEGTVVKAINDNGYKYFIQISCYKDEPNWVTWDYFLGLIFREKALDKTFVKKCLDVFNSNISVNEIDL